MMSVDFLLVQYEYIDELIKHVKTGIYKIVKNDKDKDFDRVNFVRFDPTLYDGINVGLVRITPGERDRYDLLQKHKDDLVLEQVSNGVLDENCDSEDEVEDNFAYVYVWSVYDTDLFKVNLDIVSDLTTSDGRIVIPYAAFRRISLLKKWPNVFTVTTVDRASKRRRCDEVTRSMRSHYLPRGALIAFEGLDRAGKTSHSTFIADTLRKQGLSVHTMRFPDRETKIGGVISEYLKNKVELDDRAIHLMFSVNRWEMASKIREMLNSGTTVIVDRYAFSGVAYSVAKGLDFDWCRQPDVGLPRPDLVIFLNLGVEAASQRARWGEERYETIKFQEATRRAYEKLVDRAYWEIVDAGGTIEQIRTDVLARVSALFAKGEFGEIETLWSNKPPNS